jgi:hypothetical protein
MDPHRNIYFYYSGQKKRGTERERQIEDNTTKALVNTLEFSAQVDGCGALVLPFLQWLGVVDGHKELDKVFFALQRATLSKMILSHEKRRVLVGIAPYLTKKEAKTEIAKSSEKVSETERAGRGKDLEARKQPADSGAGSRPDAWIWGRRFVVCIENKTVGTFDAKQMTAHLKTLGKGAVQKRVTWKNVYEFFFDWIHKANKKKHRMTRKLVEQFVRYLDIVAVQQEIPMGSFQGFMQEHFDAFVLIDQDIYEDNRRIVRKVLYLFVEAIRKKLTKDLGMFHEIKQGNIHQDDRSTWVTLSRTSSPVQEPHFSFAIGPEEISIVLLMEGKKPSLRGFNAISNDPSGFLRVLERIDSPEEYSIQIWRRRKVRVRHYMSTPVCEIHLKHVSPQDVNYLVSKMTEIRNDKSDNKNGGLFEFWVRRRFQRDYKGLSKPGFVKEGIKTVKELAKLEAFLR